MNFDTFRNNWHVVVLVLLLVGSGYVIFGGTVTDGGSNTTQVSTPSESSLNLNYGLDLAGGTRIRAPLVGLTAEGVPAPENPRDLERKVGLALDNADASDVTVRVRADSPDGEGQSAVEVTAEQVTREQFIDALEETNVSYSSVREGVTDKTRDETVRVLNDKLNQAGLGGGSARQITAASGEKFILIEVPNKNRDDTLSLVNQRGKVQVDIYYPTDNGYQTKEAVLERDDFKQIGMASKDQRMGPHVPVVLTDEAAQRFRTATMETGVAQQGGSRCNYEAAPNSTGPCLLTKVDGDVVYSAGMAPSLASSIQSGEWTKDPSFVLQTRDTDEAQSLAVNLRAGALPAKLNIEAGTSTYVSPTQGESFRSSSLILGILAVFAVALMVFFSYRDVRVALPMLLTALSEVFILLGVAALLKYPIDLSVVGGFIAVIGTGVDDLIIIANEVMAKGSVNSNRVFQSRYKKAFWVIGAAAVTTIIAMSPLMVLSLGDLQGFAIFTIIGVIIGVVVTRPAYGDILKHLILDRE